METLESRTLMAGDGAIRINAGGGAYTDLAGHAWSADMDFTGGTVSNGRYPVAGTSDDPLFYTRRWGTETYNIPLANGSYTLNLYFAEPVMTAAGKRVFNVSAEGQPLLTNLDLFVAAGYRNSYVRSFPISISDGALNIGFTAITENPIISAIEVIPADVTPSAPAAPTSLAASAITTFTAHLTWSEATYPAATSFTVERLDPGDSDYHSLGTTTSKFFDDTGMSDGAVYSYRVRAANDAGTSDPSDSITITTLQQLASPWSQMDIGSVAKAGSATVAFDTGTFTVSGGGADIWNGADAFHYVYQPLVGDGSIVAHLASQQNTNGWAKSGVMIRESLNADSRFADMVLTPSNGVSLQRRTSTGLGSVSSTTSAGKGWWVKLVRTGSTITGFASSDGQNWKLVGSTMLPMANNVLVGLCVTAHDNTKLNTSTFDHVAVTTTGNASSIWTAGTPAPLTRWESQTFTYNGKMYIFGGFYNHAIQATTRCDVYDPATDAWTQLATQLPIPITHAGVAQIGSVVYFAGGYVGDWTKAPATNRVFAYDIDANTWTELPTLSGARVAGGLVALGNVLHFYGGLNTTRTADMADHWAFDLDNPSAGWVSKAPMLNPRNHIGYAAVNGIAYAIGGLHVMNERSGQDAEVDAYDTATDKWTKVASLPFAWSHFLESTMVVNGKIVIVGGQANGGGGGAYVPTIAAYDPDADQWQTLTPLPEARQAASAVWIDGKLYVEGGATQDSLGEGFPQQQLWF
ncbi:MAG TPA: malectin domain-containing carbohydrate-binding protein, partial [Tepidisphaeraceae bacterium]|nr:malectin domain-containing carbohydrate-binding protein [Tepidisphaeraceae bacterium]